MHETHQETTLPSGHVEDIPEMEPFTEEEARTLFDDIARHNLQISGDEFRERWHRGDYDDDPDRPSHEHEPHVHIGSAIIDVGSSDIGKTFSRFHIPTGHISIAQVVRLLLTDFNVVPNRQDWEAALAGILSPDT
jgi:hypothetical protein